MRSMWVPAVFGVMPRACATCRLEAPRDQRQHLDLSRRQPGGANRPPRFGLPCGGEHGIHCVSRQPAGADVVAQLLRGLLRRAGR